MAWVAWAGLDINKGRQGYIPHVPLSDRLKQPSLSPANESAPHWRTMALGRYTSMTLDITCGGERGREGGREREREKRMESCLTVYYKYITHRFENGLV